MAGLGIVAIGLALVGPASTAAAAAPAAGETEDTDDTDENRDDDDTRVVVVSGRKSDGMSASARTIPRRTIDVMPKRSAEDILRLVPGLQIVQHGNQGKGYQFYLRGFDAVHGADIETLVDDIPVNEASNVHAHGYLDLAFIIPEVVDAVDADKGSLRLKQGDFATAGTIRYRLGVPQRGTRASYEFGSTNRHRVAIVHAPRGRSDDTFLAIEALHDDGYGANRRARRLSTMAQTRLWSGRGTSVTVLGSAYGARFGLPGVIRIHDVNRGAIGLYDSYTDDTAGESGRVLSALRVMSTQRRTSTRVTAYAGARRLVLDENFTGDLLFPGLGDRHRQVHEAITPGVRSETTVTLHERVRLPVLASWRGDFVQQRVDQLTATGGIWDTSRDLDLQQHALGVGAGVRADPAAWMQLEGGVRFDAFVSRVRDRLQDDRDFGGTVFAVSPRLMTRFQPGERWQLFAGYGRGLRSPEARAFTLPDRPPADVDLSRFAGGEPRMTTSDNAEVGARFQPGRIFDFGSALFGTWIGRESIFDHASGFNVERSATQRLGVEADAQLHATEWLDLGFDVTYAHARFRESGSPIPGAPPLLLSTRASLAHPRGFRGGLRWFLLGPRPLSYGATAGAATVLDVNAGYRHQWIQVDLSFDNLLGLRWREGEYHFASHWDPESPRSQIPTVHAVAGYPFGVRAAATAFF